MKIKFYTFKELKQMRAYGIGKSSAFGIPKRDYKQIAKYPQKVVHKRGTFYTIENSPYMFPIDYVKEINNEN